MVCIVPDCRYIMLMATLAIIYHGCGRGEFKCVSWCMEEYFGDRLCLCILMTDVHSNIYKENKLFMEVKPERI